MEHESDGVLYIDPRPGQACHSKDAEVTHSDGQYGEILSGWLNYYITRWTQEVSQSLETRWWQDAVEKARPQQSEPLGLRLSRPGEQERHNADGYKSGGGVNMLQFCSVSNSLSHTQPFQIKWEVYFFKEVFARLN